MYQTFLTSILIDYYDSVDTLFFIDEHSFHC